MSLNRFHFFTSVAAVTMVVALGSSASYAQPTSPDGFINFQSAHEIDFNSPVGTPIGGFFLTPGFSYSATYDDNIFRKDTNLTSDFINVFKGGAGLQTNWGRHEIYAGFQAAKTVYRRNSQKDALDYGAILSGRYDITYGTYIDGFIKKNQSNMNRGSDEDIDGSEPIQYDNWSSRIGFTRALSYIQAKIAAFNEGSERNDDTAAAVNGDFIKRDKNGVEGTLTYEYLPNNNLFVTTIYTNIDYDIVGNPSRNVDKSELKYGLNFNYRDMYSGSLYLGHLHTQYSHISEKANDPYVGFTLNWAPTQLTNVSVLGGRSYQDGNISANEKVIVDTTRLNVSHQITEFVTGGFNASLAENAYRTLDGNPTRDNKVYGIGIDAQYRVSDHMGLKLGYDYKERESNQPNDDYKNNRILFTVTYMH